MALANAGSNNLLASGTAPATTVDVTFDEVIDPISFYTEALALSSLFGQATGVGPAVDRGDGESFRVTLSDALLVASGSIDPESGALTFSWDVNGDGVYGDATGMSPTLTWTQLTALEITYGPSSRKVSVRVTDEVGLVTISPAIELTVTNAVPTAQIFGWKFLIRGQSRAFGFQSTDKHGKSLRKLSDDLLVGPLRAIALISSGEIAHFRQNERLIQFALGERPGIRGELAAQKSQLQPDVEWNPQVATLVVNHWVPRSARHELAESPRFSGVWPKLYANASGLNWEMRVNGSKNHTAQTSSDFV